MTARRAAAVLLALLAAPAPAAHAGGADGVWVVRSSASVVGFRAREKYLSLPVPTEVVGRTSVVRGTMTVARGRIVAAHVTVDMRTLKTDDAQRDETLRSSRGPVWDRHPRGTFTLRRPLPLAGGAAVGVLRLHDVSRTVRFPLAIRRRGGTIRVAGHLRTRMTAFGFRPPSVAGLTTVRDPFTIELALEFVRR